MPRLYAEAYQGAVSTESFTLQLDQEETSFDLSTVASSTFRGTKPDGTRFEWGPAVKLSQSTAQLVLDYPYASNGLDLDQLGEYSIFAYMSISGGGVQRSVSGILKVKDPYAITKC